MNETTAMELHPFEAHGLGKAPFRFVGMVCQDIDENTGMRKIGTAGGCEMQTKPGGTCAFCMTYILEMYQIASADGKRFHVGSSCVEKTGDKKLMTQVAAVARKVKKVKTDTRNAARIHAARETLPTVAGQLASQPHPIAAIAARGLTLLDWVNWMLANSGTSGRLRVARVIEDATR